MSFIGAGYAHKDWRMHGGCRMCGFQPPINGAWTDEAPLFVLLTAAETACPTGRNQNGEPTVHHLVRRY